MKSDMEEKILRLSQEDLLPGSPQFVNPNHTASDRAAGKEGEFSVELVRRMAV